MRVSRNIRNAPPKKPRSGEVIIGSTTLGQRPAAAPLASVVAQCSTFQLSPDEASAAPQRPPMSAWLELDGRPNHQVMRFQMIAAHQAREDGGHRDDVGVHEALADGAGDGGAHERADEVEDRGQGDGLAGRQHLGRDDRGDGVGGVVKAVDILEHERKQHHHTSALNSVSAAPPPFSFTRTRSAWALCTAASAAASSRP
jgi:hypothetical protein